MKLTVDVELPDWAKWRTQDRNGSWSVWYEKPEPNEEEGYWYLNAGDLDIDEYSLMAMVAAVLYGVIEVENWKEQIFEIN